MRGTLQPPSSPSSHSHPSPPTSTFVVPANAIYIVVAIHHYTVSSSHRHRTVVAVPAVTQSSPSPPSHRYCRHRLHTLIAITGVTQDLVQLLYSCALIQFDRNLTKICRSLILYAWFVCRLVCMPCSTISRNRSEAKPTFNTKKSISGLLHDRVRLDESFPMGPCSTSGDKNSLR
jgi:hypothetical protein